MLQLRCLFLHLDVELQVLVHGVDVVKDVSGDTRDDSHQMWVVQDTLKSCFHMNANNSILMILKIFKQKT